MKKSWILGTLLGFGTLISQAATVNNIGFKVDKGQSLVNIDLSGPTQHSSTYNAADRQYVVNIQSAKLAPGAKRALNASSFNSPVSLVSPYQVTPNSVRVVVQLNRDIPGNINKVGDQLRLSFGAQAEDFEEDDDFEDSEDEELAEESSEDGDLDDVDFETEEGSETNVSSASSNSGETKDTASSEDAESKDAMDEFLDARKTKNFNGSPITLKVKDANVNDVLRLIADASGFNIVVGKGVDGSLTLTLDEVPWDQALDVVLQTLNLGAERNNNVLRVLTLSNLTAEKKAELAAKQAIEASAPKVTKIFPISYADPGKLKSLLETFGNSEAKSSTTQVKIDDRTNSIIVQDTADNVDRMKKLVGILDTQTPQVLIEAKVVEATEGYNFNIGGNVAGGSSDSSPAFATTFQGGNPLSQLVGTVSTGTDFATSSADAGVFAVSPTMSFLGGNVTLNALLKLGEAENRVKVVSSPRTVVLNKQSSNILQTTPVLVKKNVQTDQGIFETEEIQQAKIQLSVTPTVTNDEGVLMLLEISRDVPVDLSTETSAVAQRSLATNVLVDSGSTLVIGGVYTMDKSAAESGFPWLRDIPFLGHFFGSKTEKVTRSELFIFVTPTVLNLERAGIAG